MKIDISDEQAAALKSKAAADGLTLGDWVRKIIEQQAPTGRTRYSLFELIGQCDPEAPLSEEDRAWIDAPATGL